MAALAQVVILLGSHFDRPIAGDTMSVIGRTLDVRGRTTQKAEMCRKLPITFAKCLPESGWSRSLTIAMCGGYCFDGKGGLYGLSAGSAPLGNSTHI